MLYVILNDGETYTSLNGCVIYDDVSNKLFSIRKRRQIGSKDTTIKWVKGIESIQRDRDNETLDMYSENYPNVNEDDGILGK